MAKLPKTYWVSPVESNSPGEDGRIDQANGDPDFIATRRSFLKAAGFSFAGALAGACSRGPAVSAIPYIQQPEGLVPGRAVQYASTCGACEAGCGVLVTTRDGRPLKIEGNPDHPLSGGATCAAGQASVLGLYDSHRLAYPTRGGQRISWAESDSAIRSALDRIRREDGAVRIVTPTITSPTTAALIAGFVSSFKNARHISYDAVPASAILDAHAQTHGVRVHPQYRFDHAEVVVSFGADFLATWISPVQYTRGYAAARHVEDSNPRAFYHVQIESRMSLTGSKADRRLRVAPSEVAHVATHLAARLARRAGVAFAADGLTPSPMEPALDALAERLWAAKPRGLAVAGSQDVRTQLLCNFMNHLMGAYGVTLDLDRPSYQRQGDERALADLRADLSSGAIRALFLAGGNLVYDSPDPAAVAADLRRVPLLVSTADRLDETASLAHFVCPAHHYLENWNDAEPVSGVVSLTQPAIHPLHDTRALIESLSVWTSGIIRPALEAIRGHWQQAIHPRSAADPGQSFDTFWNRTLERGVAEIAPSAPSSTPKPFDTSAIRAVLGPEATATNGFELVLYEKVGMHDGRHAHNAWLHELPDPVTKVTWDNYASVSPAAASRLGVTDGDVVRVTAADGPALDLPAFVQPGQHDAVVAVAVGYGRAGTERFSEVGPPWLEARRPVGRVGVTASPLIYVRDGVRQYSGRGITVTKTGGTHALASTQIHYSLAAEPATGHSTGAAVRPIVQEVTTAQLGSPSAPTQTRERETHERDLWPADHRYTGHRWGMSVDLNACTGCSSCVIACQAENNIPVVGHDEVRRKREMHWIRIDRYYSGRLEEPEVAHQPMLCQHCEHAPCETVCPVLATTHSDEGLNQQVYNRCVGTRYCANNCPYKVRRFNWFDYPHEDRLQNLVFNPNVTVRSSGVMEKCTFCVQRIEEARIEARRTGQPLADGDVKTACEQACPAQAIVFGDLNDPKSRVARLANSVRAYRVLEELGTRPAVHYLKLVRRA